MTPEEMKRVHDEHIAAESRKDLDAAMATYQDGCFYENVPLRTRFDGKEQISAYYTMLFTALPDSDLEIEGEAYGDDVLVAWGTFRGTVQGEFMGLPATGRTLALPVVAVNTFKDGLMLGEHLYFDLATLAEQAGFALDDVLKATAPLRATPATA